MTCVLVIEKSCIILIGNATFLFSLGTIYRENVMKKYGKQ
jgi:hypothetical protein